MANHLMGAKCVGKSCSVSAFYHASGRLQEDGTAAYRTACIHEQGVALEFLQKVEIRVQSASLITTCICSLHTFPLVDCKPWSALLLLLSTFYFLPQDWLSGVGVTGRGASVR